MVGAAYAGLVAANGRGRPATIDRDHVVTVAMELFSTQGFATTTMDQIAAAAGISRKSLFLYFPAKGDLIWHRSAGFVENLREDIAGAHGDAAEAVAAAIVSGYRDAHGSRETLRTQIRVHENDPGVQEIIESHSREWRAIASERFTRDGVDPLLAEMLAYGFWRAMWIAMESWVGGSDDLPVVLRDQLDITVAFARRLIAADGSARAEVS